MRRTARFVAVAVALLLAGAGCNGDDGEAGGDTTTTEADATTTSAAPTTTEATTTTLTAEEEVLTAYRAVSAALAAANDPPNPNHPELLAHMAGEALERTQGLLGQLVGQGVSVVGTVELHPTLVTLAGDTAVIEDCFLERSQYVNTVTREPVGQAGERVWHIESHLERIDGVWKVVREQELTEPCTPG